MFIKNTTNVVYIKDDVIIYPIVYTEQNKC
jgi:hypothetical protein